MRVVLAIFSLVLLLACQSEKKPVVTDPSQTADYKEALNNFKIGCNYLNRQDTAQAIHYLELACKGDENNFRYRHWLGFAYMINGQLIEAERELKRAVEINPEHSDSYNNLATLYMETERFEEAQQALKTVLADETYQQPQLAYFNLGLCYRRQGAQDQAIAAFEQATRQDPDFYRAYLQIGQIHKQAEDYEKALHYFIKAEAGYPNDPGVLFEIGHAYFQLERYEEASKFLAQVSILFPPPSIDNPTQEMLQIIRKKID